MADELVERLGVMLTEVGGRLHETGSLRKARRLAGQLAGDAPVARWSDPALDGVGGPDADPAAAEVSLVVADAGVAATGQIALVHGEGRPRAAGLLPERQIVLLAREEVRETLEEALASLFAGGRVPSSVVLVSGPSRTADIEQRSIQGVHAPRELDVIVHPAK